MEVMIDLETLSTRMNAVVLVIAGIKFDRSKEIKEPEKSDFFYRRIDVASFDKTHHIDQQTLTWWKYQPINTYNEAFGDGIVSFAPKGRIPIKQALMEFARWFGNSKQIWSNGNTFDIPILAELYLKFKIPIPWKYYNCRDTRTMYELGKVDIKNLSQENLHNALYDCWRQIIGVNMAYNNLFAEKYLR